PPSEYDARTAALAAMCSAPPATASSPSARASGAEPASEVALNGGGVDFKLGLALSRFQSDQIRPRATPPTLFPQQATPERGFAVAEEPKDDTGPRALGRPQLHLSVAFAAACAG